MSRLLLAGCAALLCCACEGDETASPAGPLEGILELELRDSAEVTIAVGPDGRTTAVKITPTAGYGLWGDGTVLDSAGSVEAFPEARGTLYVAKFSLPAHAAGPCGDQPVSLALSLHRQGANAMVLGGLSAYCGADTYHGVPVRVLRLAGSLPLP